MKILFLLLILVLFFKGCADEAILQQPANNKQYKIAFTFFNDSLGEALGIMNSDGNNFKLLNTTGTIFNVLWSHDGSKIAFDIYMVKLGVINPDGSGYRIFENLDVRTFSWFKDARNIAVSSSDSLYSLDVVSGQKRFMGLGNSPAVSPTGDKVAFIRDSKLYTTNIDGTNEIFLCDSAESSISWSPTSNLIIFIRQLDIYSIDLNSNEIKQLTHNRNFLRRLSWSPDGSSLVYDTFDNDIRITNVYSGDERIILTGATSPNWCNDGPAISCITKNDILIIKEDGSIINRIADINPELSATWSPVAMQ